MPNNMDSLAGCLKAPDLDQFIVPSEQEATLNCIGGFPYYIVSVRDGCGGCEEVCAVVKGGEQCTRNLFSALPGMVKNMFLCPIS